MGTYTVSFFGQDETDGYGTAEERLRKIIKFLINSKEYVEFLVDRESEFNIFASNIIHNMASSPYIGNKTRVIMFPYTSTAAMKIFSLNFSMKRKYLKFYVRNI